MVLFFDKAPFSNKQKIWIHDEDECTSPLVIGTMIGHLDVVISGGDDTQSYEGNLRAGRSSRGPQVLVETISSCAKYGSPLTWESALSWVKEIDSQHEGNFVVKHARE